MTGNNIVTVGGTEIRKIEYRGQQVVTYGMIDQVHGRPDGTAKRNFDENRERFVVGEDFFDLTRDEIRTNLPEGLFSKFAPKAHLITRRGYLKITKSLNDDKAWEVFDEMIERYFAATNVVAPEFQIPQTFAEALRLAAKQSEQIEKQAKAIEEMSPKAEFHDNVAAAINAQDFQAVAKVLGTGRTRFMGWLRDRGYLMKGNRPYQRYEDAGYFRVVEGNRKDPHTGESITYTKTLVTGKGLTYLQKKWQEDHPAIDRKAG
jgi:phage antirepressor YoqD-like protein